METNKKMSKYGILLGSVAMLGLVAPVAGQVTGVNTLLGVSVVHADEVTDVSSQATVTGSITNTAAYGYSGINSLSVNTKINGTVKDGDYVEYTLNNVAVAADALKDKEITTSDGTVIGKIIYKGTTGVPATIDTYNEDVTPVGWTNTKYRVVFNSNAANYENIEYTFGYTGQQQSWTIVSQDSVINQSVVVNGNEVISATQIIPGTNDTSVKRAYMGIGGYASVTVDGSDVTKVNSAFDLTSGDTDSTQLKSGDTVTFTFDESSDLQFDVSKVKVGEQLTAGYQRYVSTDAGARVNSKNVWFYVSHQPKYTVVSVTPTSVTLRADEDFPAGSYGVGKSDWLKVVDTNDFDLTAMKVTNIKSTVTSKTGTYNSTANVQINGSNIDADGLKVKRGSVIVKLVDSDTGSELSGSGAYVVQGEKEGTAYSVDPTSYNVDGYVYDSVGEGASLEGSVKEGTQTVVLKFSKDADNNGVKDNEQYKTRYVDTETNKTLKADQVGKSYAGQETFSGYTFVNDTTDDATSTKTYNYVHTKTTNYVLNSDKTKKLADSVTGANYGDAKTIKGYVLVGTEKDAAKYSQTYLYEVDSNNDGIPDKDQQLITKWVDESGKDLKAQTSALTFGDAGTFDGYTLISSKTSDDGKTMTHTFHKNQTKFVDKDGNPISDTVDGTVDKIDIDNYTYVSTTTDENGDTIHNYIRNTTKFVDEDGNSISEDVDSYVDPIDISEYKYIRTDEDAENATHTHVYHHIQTTYVDEDGNPIGDPEWGTQDAGTIDGYEFVRTETDENGDVHHIYKKKAQEQLTNTGLNTGMTTGIGLGAILLAIIGFMTPKFLKKNKGSKSE